MIARTAKTPRMSSSLRHPGGFVHHELEGASEDSFIHWIWKNTPGTHSKETHFGVGMGPGAGPRWVARGETGGGMAVGGEQG
jgi:hypothetical protein